MKKFFIMIFFITTPSILFSQLKQITFDDAQNYHPRWSPDQDFILYTSRDASNQPALKLFDIQNDSILNINTGKKGDHYTNWVQGTKQFLFDCNDESGRMAIWEFSLATMKTKEIIGNQVCFHPCPSPDGNMIVFSSYKTGNAEIFIFDLITQQTEQVTFNQDTDHHPIWSHDSQKIIFESDRSGNFDIYEYYIKEKKIKPLIVTNGFDGHASLSPDGKYLAYSHGPTGMRNIIIRNISNGKEFPITEGYDNSWPDWSKDYFIVLVSNRGGNMNLYMIDVFDLLKNVE